MRRRFRLGFLVGPPGFGKAGGHGVKVRLFSNLVGSPHPNPLDACANHNLGKVRTPPQKEFMVVRAAVTSGILSEIPVQVQLSLKGAHLALRKESIESKSQITC